MDWWNPMDPAFLADPYPQYRRLRHEADFLWHEGLASWVTGKYETCMTILRDHESFASDYRRVGEQVPEEFLSLQTLDPPEHDVVHQIFARAIKAQDLVNVSVLARQRTRVLMNKILQGEGGNFITEVAIPVSTECSLALLGAAITVEDLTERSAAVVASMNSGLLPETNQPGIGARRSLSQLVGAMLTQGSPVGLIHEIKPVYDSQPEIAPFICNSLRVVMLAGINSTQRAVGLAALAILSRKDSVRSLADADDERLLNAARELIRFDSPVQAQERKVACTTRIGETELPASATVVVLLGSANRDETAFTDPDCLSFDRPRGRSISFGRGVHACLGAAVAPVVISSVLRELLPRIDDISLASPPEFEENPTLRGLQTLHIKPLAG